MAEPIVAEFPVQGRPAEVIDDLAGWTSFMVRNRLEKSGGIV